MASKRETRDGATMGDMNDPWNSGSRRGRGIFGGILVGNGNSNQASGTALWTKAKIHSVKDKNGHFTGKKKHRRNSVVGYGIEGIPSPLALNKKGAKALRPL